MEDKIRTTCDPNKKHGGNHSGAGYVVWGHKGCDEGFESENQKS